ncbi:MAG TPA: uracil phosphoribosyltransferase, partial [Candidatus Obscuribacterales bacterium]|nr:uracil phosphoribosyltransferase [Candidatus Obscuribacterales bacterium]
MATGTDTSKITIVNHPLTRNILTRLRDYQTPSGEFREKARQLSYFLVYEAMRELGVREVGVETPIGPAKG